MKGHLTLPTRRGSVTLETSRIDEIEWTGEGTCKIHMKRAHVLEAEDDKFSHKGYGASAAHNTFEVNWSAYELRAVIAGMSDGDHFDPLNLETLDDE